MQPYLQELDQTIRAAIPDATGKIAWSMPTYWKQRNLVHFAAFKKHIGFYPGAEAVETFAGSLQGYKIRNGSIQFPYEEPLPLDLIARIAKWCDEKGESK